MEARVAFQAWPRPLEHRPARPGWLLVGAAVARGPGGSRQGRGRGRVARARASRHARGRARGHYICRGARAPRPPRAYRQTYQWRIGRSVSLSAFSPASALAHRGRHSGKREIILAGRVHGRAFSYCWIGEKGASSALASHPCRRIQLRARALHGGAGTCAAGVFPGTSDGPVCPGAAPAPLHTTPLNTQPTA